jgi:hypothetical protein
MEGAVAQPIRTDKASLKPRGCPCLAWTPRGKKAPTSGPRRDDMRALQKKAFHIINNSEIRLIAWKK